MRNRTTPRTHGGLLGLPLPPVAVVASLITGLLAMALAACSGAAAPPSAGSPSLASSPALTVGPLEDTTVDTLLAEAAARDGQIVAVSGDFVADQESAQLCAFLVVSPEQRCEGRIRLTGEVPAETLALLETHRAGQLQFGYVTVIGTFRASDADGQPTIEIDEIFVAQ